MKQMSIGEGSPLENWITWCTSVFGENSAQVNILKEKANNASNGVKEEVSEDEEQLLAMLLSL